MYIDSWEYNAKLDQQAAVIKTYRLSSKLQNKSLQIIAEITSSDQKRKLQNLQKKRKIKAHSVNVNWEETGIFIYNYFTKYNII